MRKLENIRKKYQKLRILWLERDYPSGEYDWKKSEKKNLTTALNMLYAKKQLFPAYLWKYTLNHKQQAILLMIPNGEGWHYLELKHYLHY